VDTIGCNMIIRAIHQLIKYAILNQKVKIYLKGLVD